MNPDELAPPLEAVTSLDSREPAPDSVGAAQSVIESLIEEYPSDVAGPAGADTTPPANDAANIPELEEVRRVYGETGVAQVLQAVQEIQTHTAAEVAKVPEVIPEWRDPTVRAIELPEILKFARERGATDEQIADFDLHGTAAELKNWRDFWRASHPISGTDERPARRDYDGDVERTIPRRPRASRQQQAQVAIARVAKTGRQRDAQAAIEALGLAD